MNKIFKVIWNVQMQMFIVVSELAKGYCYSSKRSTDNHKQATVTIIKSSLMPLTLIISSFFSSSLYAVNITVQNSTPQSAIEQIISGSTHLTGDFSNIARGAEGYKPIKLGEARDQGLVREDSVKWIDYDIFRLGPQTKTINYYDSITNTTTTMKVFDNNEIQTEPVSDFSVTISTAVGSDGQYVDRNFYQIGSGASLDVDVGTATEENWFNDVNNQFNAILKSSSTNDNPPKNTTSAFLVKDAGTLNYSSKTVVTLGNSNNNFKSETNPLAWMNVDKFAGEVDSVIGTFSVTDVESFKAYNTALIEALESGRIKLTEAEYKAELDKARDTGIHDIYGKPSVIDGSDAVKKVATADTVSYIHGTGENTEINIKDGANIELVYSDATLVNLEDKAKLINDGTLGKANNTNISGYIVVAKTGATVENNGTIDAGTNPDMVAYYGGNAASASEGVQLGILADGVGTIINNNANGVINIAARSSTSEDNIAVTLQNSAVFNNTGTINIAASAENNLVGSGSNYGVKVSDNATFNHNGTINIGLQAYDTTQNLDIKQLSVAVQLYDGANYSGATSSEIIVGSGTKNATAIDIDVKKDDETKGDITFSQQGVITINGSSSTGIKVWHGTLSNIITAGTIDINGVDDKGIHVVGGGEITSAGAINVNSGLDLKTNYDNFGIYAKDANTKVTLSGGVNLNGSGAIGVHVRDGAHADVTQTGTVTFSGADSENQFGYFIYGKDSGITNQNNNQTVSTKGSTLYRIDGGAIFTGASVGTARLNATGESSTIVQVTGASSSFDSGNVSLSIEGDNSTGIRIEGGATGTIAQDNNIVLISGENATAGIVDGNYYNLDGSLDESKKGNSILTSKAKLVTNILSDGAFGYIARNGGTLIHNGSIDFTTNSNSTGILVDSGTLVNNSDVTVNGIAVDIQGEDSVVTNNANGVVAATDGTAAYRVGSGASLTLNGNGITNAAGSAHGVLLDTGATGLSIDGATINMDSAGSGSAIENVAAISGIQLKDTTMNVGNGIGVHTGASLAQTNSGTITVNGSGTGILFENIDGTTTTQSLDTSGSKDLVINVNSANGKGIVTNTSTDLKTGASVNILDNAGNAALIVEGTTKNIEQSGTLTSLSDTSAVVKIDNNTLKSFTNKGSIQAKDKDHKALEMDSGSGITFTNTTGGAITGEVNLLSGNNTVILESGSTATDVTTGAGNDQFILKNINNETNLFTSLNGGLGYDTLTLDNAKYTMNQADAITGMERIVLGDHSEFTLNNVLLALGDDKSDGAGTGYTIDSSSKLNLKSSTDLTFKSHLAGTGTVTVDAVGNNFNFTDNNKADGFVGTVALTNSKFELSGKNTQALTSATLLAGAGSITHVGTGTQNIGGLAFDGGTIQFDDVTPGKSISDGTIHAQKMDLTGNGFVQVDIGAVAHDHPVVNSNLSVLEQDDGNLLIKLASSATAVQGSAGDLELQDTNGNRITSGITADISQNGSVVAEGTYDYRLTSGDSSDGLYINYGLTQVELLGTGNNALILDANGKTGNAADLSAKVIGSGDLALDSQQGETVTLSNSANNYTGITDVRSGNLAMLNNNVLGQTSELKLATNTGFDMQGHSQTIGKLTAANGSLTNLNNGHLTLTNGGTSEGQLTGSGKLTISGDTLTVSGANNNLEAETTIATGATAALNNTAGLGTGNIVIGGTLLLTNADGVLKNNISSTTELLKRSMSNSGQVVLNNSNVTLTGDNSNFNGLFDIDNASNLTASEAKQLGTAKIKDAGILTLNTANDWTLVNAVDGTGAFVKNGLGTVTLKNSAKWTGNTDINQGRIVLGGISSDAFTLASSQVNIHAGSQLSGFGGVAGNIDNKGTLLVGTESTVGNDFIVNGDYVGNNGNLYLNTVLGDDNSVTDKLIVKGNTSGNTLVTVTNIGGAGDYTINGIKVIQVDGQSDGVFTQKGRIVAGAYDYLLVKGQDGQNWYLTNQKSNSNTDKNVRPESGSYTANLAAANTLFVTRLHDRLGETQYIDALTGEQKVTSMWLRQVGGHNKWSDNTGQLETQNNRYVMQLGGDIANWNSDGLDRWHLGVMAGYGHNHSNTHSSAQGHNAKGSVNGYSAGVYGTWYANDQTHQGTYIDSWAQYSWFNNSIKGDDIQRESYKSKGLAASLETGYTYKLGEFTGTRGLLHEAFIQPQAQIVWMGVKADNFRESSVYKTRIQGQGDGNIQTRLGLRTFINNKNITEDNIVSDTQPYVELNWIHNTRSFGTQMGNETIRQAGARNLGEIKTGVEGQINPHLNIWGNVALQAGEQGYRDASAMIGVKYNFQ